MPLTAGFISPELRQTFPSSPLFTAFFKQFESAFISSWAQSPVHRWFFSARFFPPSSSSELVVGLLKWEGGESPVWLPCLFECLPQAKLASAKHWHGHLSPVQIRETEFFEHRQGHTHPTVFQPAPCLETILNHQPVSEPLQLTINFFPKTAEPLPPYSPFLKRYHDPQWQQFAEASQVLNQLFRQISSIDQENGLISFQDLIALLYADPHLSQPLKKSLVQCFSQYLSHFSHRPSKIASQSGIEIFWQTFFQLLFQSLPVPASLGKFSSCGFPVTLNAKGISKELYCFQCISQANERLYWYVQYNKTTKNWELLDIQRLTSEQALPTYLPAFAFWAAFQALSPERQTMLQPYWRYFLPMQKIQALQQEIPHGCPA